MHPILQHFSLQAGGAHYPEINTRLQEAFARLIISKCAEIADSKTSAPFKSYGDLIRDYFGINHEQPTNT